MTKHQCLDHGEVAFCDGCLVDSLHHEISQLKAQLNNMEACYIEKKKQVEDQQKRIDGALTWLTRTDIRPINCAREILRGAND